MGRKAIEKDRTKNPKKRRDLAEGLLSLIEGRGLDGLTMDELAGMLGRSKATVYKYFESREALIGLSLEIKLERISGFVPLLKDRDQPYLDRYYHALELISAELSTISNDFLADLRRHFPEQWAKIEQLQEFAGQILGVYYQEGLEKGLLQPIHPAVLVLSDQFLFRSLSDPEFLEANGLGIAEAFEAYFRMKFFGLVPRN